MKALRCGKGRILIAAAIVLLLGTSCVYAQLEDIGYYRDKCEFDSSKLNGWRWQAGLVLGMTITIILAGAATATLPKTKLQQYQMWIIVCGSLVAVLTGLKDVIWAEDYQTLKRRIVMGERILFDLSSRLRNYNLSAPAEERNFRYGQVVNLSAEFDSLWMGSGGGNASPIAFWGRLDDAFSMMIPRAEASQTVTRNPRFVYFEGVGMGHDFATAKNYAEANARSAAMHYLTEVLPPSRASAPDSAPVEDLAAFLIERGQPGEGDFQKSADGLYRFTASWAVDRMMLGSQIELYTSRQNVQMDHVQMQKAVQDISSRPNITRRTSPPSKVSTPPPDVEEPPAKRTGAYERDLGLAHSILPEDNFERYNRAVFLLDQDSTDEAVELFTDLSALGTTYPIIWLRLSEAYTALGNETAAQQYRQQAETGIEGQTDAVRREQFEELADYFNSRP